LYDLSAEEIKIVEEKQRPSRFPKPGRSGGGKQNLDLAVAKSHRAERARSSRKYSTARQLLNSKLIGMWQDRTDIGDSAVYAQRLREQAQ
jgi:hypothetical protein